MSFDIFRCRKCGWITSAEPKGSIGTAHAHSEKHTSLWKLPAWILPSANPQKLDKSIELLEVEKVEEE